MRAPSAGQGASVVADPELCFADGASFEAWLESNHVSAPAIWLKIAKKGAPAATVTYGEAVETALCFGWIDGQKDRLDEHYWLQRFTPRRTRSRWSRINRQKAERLMTQGRMRAAGLAAVEQARADGRWEAAYAGSATATVPADLQQALDLQPAAAAVFASLDARDRYAMIYRVNDAKRPETRQRRIAKFIDMLLRGERLHPSR